MTQCFTLSNGNNSDLVQSGKSKRPQRSGSAKPELRSTPAVNLLQFNAKDSGQTKRIEKALNEKDLKGTHADSRTVADSDFQGSSSQATKKGLRGNLSQSPDQLETTSPANVVTSTRPNKFEDAKRPQSVKEAILASQEKITDKQNLKNRQTQALKP